MTNNSEVFFTAAQQGDIVTITRLLNGGQPVDAIDNSGVTALIYAARAGHLEAVRVLVDFGAEVDGLGMNQRLTPLQQAAWNNNLECARYLIQKGADVNADYDRRPGWSGMTPLMYALDEMSSPDVARLLVEYGADVNVRGESGTAIEVAASYGAEDVVEVLRLAGAKE